MTISLSKQYYYCLLSFIIIRKWVMTYNFMTAKMSEGFNSPIIPCNYVRGNCFGLKISDNYYFNQTKYLLTYLT